MSWFSKDTSVYLHEIWKDLWYYSSLSFSIALSIIFGLGLGYWIDTAHGWSPIGTLIGLFLGICAGFRNIYLAMKKAQEMK